MSAGPGIAARAEREGLLPAFAAVRARLGLVALLVALGGVAWWSTAHRMAGMDAGPGTDLGELRWFVGVWVVMMAAMMFPAVSPTVALYARMARRQPHAAPLAFTSGYLLVWTAIGLVAYGFFDAVRAALGPELAWDRAGQWVAAGVVLVAAVYELTPQKDVCLSKCRSPLGFLLGAWRSGLSGALQMGIRHGVWCLGCCWALMAALFALGVMSLAWMAFVAALISVEKILPWKRVATYGTAALLLVLGVLLVAAPAAIPGLTIPGSDRGAPAMMHGGMEMGGP